jgi:hypothetical protein
LKRSIRRSSRCGTIWLAFERLFRIGNHWKFVNNRQDAGSDSLFQTRDRGDELAGGRDEFNRVVRRVVSLRVVGNVQVVELLFQLGERRRA